MLETTPIKSIIKTHKLAGFDIETYGNENLFLMGSIVSDQGVFTSWDREQFTNHILSAMYDGYYIYATNLGFDFFGLFGLKAQRIFLPVFSKSHLISIKCKPENFKTRFFYDTLNFFPTSVENLGKVLGIEKLKKPDFLGHKPKNDVDKKYLEKYNVNDARITYEFMKLLQDKFNTLNIELKSTIASTSLDCYRRNFMPRSTWQPSESVLNNMYNAYYGGRCETFYRGWTDKQLYLYDVNSLYPAEMRNLYPMTESLIKSKKPTINDIFSYEGVARCTIEANPDLFYPILPFRDKDKKLLFPLGTWSGWYAFPELRYAMQNGYKVIPHFAYIYKKTYYPFRDFVDRLYSLRMKHPKDSIVFKLLLNSLYGKWAMRWGDRIMYKPMTNIRQLPEGFLYESNGWGVYKENGEPAKYVNPIFSIYTTSYGRVKLHKLLTKHKALYCDTDSIITTDKDVKHSTKLGQLKLEHEIKECILVKPKLYYIDSKQRGDLVKSKGAYIKDKKGFNALLSEGKLVNTRFTKFKKALKSEKLVNEIYQHDLHFNLEDDKRRWNNQFSLKRFMSSYPHIVIDGVVA